MMRIAALLLLGALASPLRAETPPVTILEAAVYEVPSVVGGTRTDATNDLHLRDYVIAEEPVACEQLYLGQWLDEWFSRVIGEELAASYAANGAHPRRIQPDTAPVRVLPLRSFMISGDEYDWKALTAAHPEVRGVVRMSQPALDSQGVYAIVHYEVLTPAGRAFANFERFEKQSDGTWRAIVGVTGDLKSDAAIRRESARAELR